MTATTVVMIHCQSKQTSVSHLAYGAAQKGTKTFSKETNNDLPIRPRRGWLQAGLHRFPVSSVLLKCMRICKTWNGNYVPFSDLMCCIQLEILSTTPWDQPAAWEVSLRSRGRIEFCRAGVGSPLKGQMPSNRCTKPARCPGSFFTPNSASSVFCL